MVGSAAALAVDDVICAQYRETGVFQQRGYTLKDFMSQLFSNHSDPGKGRNMPCHYSGRSKVGVVSPGRCPRPSYFLIESTNNNFDVARNCVHACNSDPSRNRGRIRFENGRT